MHAESALEPYVVLHHILTPSHSRTCICRENNVDVSQSLFGCTNGVHKYVVCSGPLVEGGRCRRAGEEAVLRRVAVLRVGIEL